MMEIEWEIEKYGGTTVLKFTRERQIEIGRKITSGEKVRVRKESNGDVIIVIPAKRRIEGEGIE